VDIHNPCSSKAALVFDGDANVQRSRLFLIVFFLLSVFCIATCGQYARTLIRMDDPKSVRSVSSIFAESADDPSPQRFVRRGSILGYFAVLFLTYLLIAVVVLFPPPHTIVTTVNVVRVV